MNPLQNKKIKNKFSNPPKSKKLNSLAMKLLGDISLKGYKSFYSAKERKELGIKTGTPSHPLESLHSRRSKSPKQREELT